MPISEPPLLDFWGRGRAKNSVESRGVFWELLGVSNGVDDPIVDSTIAKWYKNNIENYFGKTTYLFASWLMKKKVSPFFFPKKVAGVVEKTRNMWL